MLLCNDDYGRTLALRQDKERYEMPREALGRNNDGYPLVS